MCCRVWACRRELRASAALRLSVKRKKKAAKPEQQENDHGYKQGKMADGCGKRAKK
jgi:hypothetical protein